MAVERTGRYSALYERLREAPMIGLPLVGAAASLGLISGPVLLCGFVLREPAAAAAVWDLIDGTDANGELRAGISLAASGMVVMPPTEDGIFCRGGLFAKRTSGSLTGAVYVKAEL